MMPSLRTDRALIRAGARSTRYVLARFVAPAAPPREARLPVSVAIVLDRSGSMAEERKFALAREAVEHALRLLRPEDRFALVVYDTEIDVLAPCARATAEAKRRALDALAAVGPRGGTDLCGGWMRGCEQIADVLTPDAITRCLLLTDGLANHGITDRAELARHAGELRRRGVATSTFGVGADFDERLLKEMAHDGGGNFYFIESARDIPRLLTSELGEALEVTVRDAALVVELPRGADAEPLNRFRFVHAAGDGELRVELGDLVSEQEMQVVVRVTCPRGEPGERIRLGATLTGRGVAAQPLGTVDWTHASHPANDAQPRDREVDRVVAELYAARARADAAEANRAGDYERARRVLHRTAERIRSYAGDDATLRRIARSLDDDTPVVAAAMSPMSLKQMVFAAEASTRSRDASGRARRRS